MTSSVLFDRTIRNTTGSPSTGRYAYCAKCGEDKDENSHYVHDPCRYPYKAGGFQFCVVCDKQWDTESRDYVCTVCLA